GAASPKAFDRHTLDTWFNHLAPSDVEYGWHNWAQGGKVFRLFGSDTWSQHVQNLDLLARYKGNNVEVTPHFFRRGANGRMERTGDPGQLTRSCPHHGDVPGEYLQDCIFDSPLLR